MGRSAAGAATTRSSACAATAGSTGWTRRCARSSGSAPTSCWPPGCARTRPSPRPWTSPVIWPGSARRGSSTPCSAGWPPGISRPGSGSRPRAATPIRSGIWPSGTATPGGWSRCWPTRSAKTLAGSWPRPRPPWRPTEPGPGSPCAWCPAWLTLESSQRPAANPPPGRPLARTWPAGTRARSRRSGPGARPSRTRRASSPRSRSPGWSWPARGSWPGGTAVGSTCAPARAARPGCWPGWRRSAGHTCWLPTPGRTGPGWPATRWRSPARRPPRRSTRPRLPGVRARSTGCWPTSRAPGSGPCAAARRPAGAGRRRTSRAWAGCSAACSAAHWTRSGPEAWSATSPAPRTGPKPGTSWRMCFADGTTSRCSTRQPSWLRCQACAARNPMAGTPSSGHTGTARTRSSWPCCAAAPTPEPAAGQAVRRGRPAGTGLAGTALAGTALGWPGISWHR